ncbi:hypothetical protein niasHS_007352 [Heterodera schachtii]|uniref:Uncharacterized protein n=1 Tax=Heterodera schachtii TaxID=97005 RepID=A0ABD2JK27_HETSC
MHLHYTHWPVNGHGRSGGEERGRGEGRGAMDLGGGGGRPSPYPQGTDSNRGGKSVANVVAGQLASHRPLKLAENEPEKQPFLLLPLLLLADGRFFGTMFAPSQMCRTRFP